MLFKYSAFLLPLAAFVSGAAVPEAQGGVTTQEVVSFTTYTDPNFQGASRTWTITTQSQCIGVSGSDWNDVISSVSIPAGFRCRFWSSNHCDGDSTPDIYAPGAAAFPKNMDNKSTSFKCYRN